MNFRRADGVIPAIDSMREQNDSWVIVGMHGVGAGTHNDFMTTEEHRQLIDWIAAQREWLDAVTMQEVALRG